MIKAEELKHPNSCLNRAHDAEMLFVLLGRDVAAPAAILAWIKERIRLGKNRYSDHQIIEAQQCIAQMRQQQKPSETVNLPPKPKQL